MKLRHRLTHFPHRHLFAASLVGAATLLILTLWPRPEAQAFAPSLNSPAMKPFGELHTTREATEDGTSSSEPAPLLTERSSATEEPLRDTPQLTTRSETVKPGDNMARIFKRQGLSPATLHSLVHSDPEGKTLASLRPGQTLEFKISQDGQMAGMLYKRNPTTSFEFTRTPEGFELNKLEREYEVKTGFAAGQIDDSFYLSAQRAGLSDRSIMDLANLFGWDIDFAMDIRRGDRFQLLYEELYLDGEKIRNGDILAASFNSRGKAFTAYRFERDGNTEYYSADGRSLRKAFMRNPVAIGRISSRFNLKRKHPILHTIRAHKGVDYAAPRGTPIRATGSGKVIFAGTKGGYGRTVVLQHGQQYTTLYAHMKNYGKGIRKGARVKQGQTIGYIGSSGLATGPHLHYEFRTNGVHVDPLRVKLPDAAPIPAKHKAAFMALAEKKQGQLDRLQQARTLAQADTDN